MSYRSYRRSHEDADFMGYLGYVIRWTFLGAVIGVILLVLFVASYSH